MKLAGILTGCACLLGMGFAGETARADVFAMPSGLTSLQLVIVRGPGNSPDTRYCNRSVGSVAYTYWIGRFDVTAGQYCEFLNAVAATDPCGLYNSYMDTNVASYGCDIRRSGSPGAYSYTVPPDRANRPVNLVGWGDAARFANWLTNGQPVGPQESATTEDGSYCLNGANDDSSLIAVPRKPGARYVIPTEDEWYKAAYYDPAKPGGAGYWDYPTRSNAYPINVLDPTGTNNANYYDYHGIGTGGFTIGSPYWRTEVGAFLGSPGPYGTYDQGGNVWQWNETAIAGTCRTVRGGTFNATDAAMHASFRRTYFPTSESSGLGFRVACVGVLAGPDLLTPGDSDGDGDLDSSDLAHFLTCRTGAGDLQSASSCRDADLDQDGDVDQEDFGLLQRCLSGPGNPADPLCAGFP